MDVYVSRVGDDANDGASEATAKKTITRAMTALAPGGTLHLGAGVCGAPGLLTGTFPDENWPGTVLAQATELVARCRWSAARAEILSHPDWLIHAFEEAV